MNPFVRSLLVKKQKPHDPFTEGERRQLANLTTHDGWPILLRLLDMRLNLIAERLLHDENRVHFHRGHIYGLRDVVREVEKYLKSGEEKRGHQRPAEPIDHRSATYGTAFWDA